MFKVKASPIRAVVKLGGSAISEKGRKRATPKKDVMERLAQEIFSTRLPCVIVHGGGSYGHPLAKRYHLVEGYKSPKQLEGVAETHQSMVALNSIVTDALIKVGCPALAVSPSSCFTTDNSRIDSAFLEPITSALQLGCTPVLYGDMAFDKRLGFTILSGDQIASYLARKLKAKRLVFALELDGVYTKDPSLKGARLIQRLSLNKLVRLAARASSETNGNDVTGGMRQKLLESIPAVREGITVCFAGVSREGNIRSAIKGNDFKGTLVEGSRGS